MVDAAIPPPDDGSVVNTPIFVRDNPREQSNTMFVAVDHLFSGDHCFLLAKSPDIARISCKPGLHCFG